MGTHDKNEQLRNKRAHRAEKETSDATTGNGQEENDSWQLHVANGRRRRECSGKWKNQHGASDADEQKPPTAYS
jgi:hypothetical protein